MVGREERGRGEGGHASEQDNPSQGGERSGAHDGLQRWGTPVGADRCEGLGRVRRIQKWCGFLFGAELVIFLKKYHLYVNHISDSSKSNKDVKNLPIFNKNIPKQLDLLKVYYKISFWRINHNFINFLSEVKNSKKVIKLSTWKNFNSKFAAPFEMITS
jgi:hypothetical protein